MGCVTVLGVDPGSRVTGFGLIRLDGSRTVHVDNGCIRIAEFDLPARLTTIFRELSGVIADFQPDHVAIEKIFISRNPESALKLGQARGSAIVACAQSGIPIYEYSATAIKQAIVGRGHADKKQVQHMVKALLCLPAKPQADAADALAAAICHGHTHQGLGKTRALNGEKENRLQ